MPEIRVNRLYYEEHGTGEPIVCLHGAGSSAAVWSDAVAELAKHGRTIAYDRRGHSRSERPEPYAATNVHEQADDGAALVGALGAAPAIVIGRSYGGAVAIDLALRYPDRVRALVLLEGDAPSFSEEATRWIADVTDGAGSGREGHEHGWPDGDRGRCGPGRVGDAARALRELLTDNGPALVAEVRSGYPELTAEQLATIDQPALLVAAEESLQPGFEEVTSAMAAAMPSARVEWVKGGHLIDPAHPSVLAFVDEVLAGV